MLSRYNIRDIRIIPFAFILLYVLPPRCSAQGQLRCYNCTAVNSEDNCAMIGPSTPTASGCWTCINQVSYFGVYTRECSAFYEPTDCVENRCACNTPLCNNLAFTALGSLSCYECEGAGPMLDNGCGKSLDPNSVYVTQVHGCRACFKQKTFQVYSRGCVREPVAEGDCQVIPPDSTSDCSFQCTTNLCNSARPELNHFTLIVAILATIALICFFWSPQ